MIVEYFTRLNFKRGTVDSYVNRAFLLSIPINTRDLDQCLWEVGASQFPLGFDSRWIHQHMECWWGEVNMDKPIKDREKIWASLTASLIDPNKTMVKVTTGITRASQDNVSPEIQLQEILEICQKACRSFVQENFKAQIGSD